MLDIQFEPGPLPDDGRGVGGLAVVVGAGLLDAGHLHEAGVGATPADVGGEAVEDVVVVRECVNIAAEGSPRSQEAEKSPYGDDGDKIPIARSVRPRGRYVGRRERPPPPSLSRRILFTKLLGSKVQKYSSATRAEPL